MPRCRRTLLFAKSLALFPKQLLVSCGFSFSSCQRRLASKTRFTKDRDAGLDPSLRWGDDHISGRGVSGFASGARTACGMQGPGVEPCIPNWLLQLKCCNAALILLPPIAGTCASCRSQVFVTIGCFDVCDRLVRYHGCHFRNHGGLSVEGGICHADHRNKRQSDDQRQWQNLVMCIKRHLKSPPCLSVCFRCLVS